MGTLEDAVVEATVTITGRDLATRELALFYARSIDRGGDLSKLGPALLSALEALQLSPRARKAVSVVAGNPKTNPLDEIAERRRRKRDAPAVDSGAP